MTTMTQAWKRNTNDINAIIAKISSDFQLHRENFKREAFSIFFLKFEKYYEGDDRKYLNFFHTCLKNLAKNKKREEKIQRRCISSYVAEDGSETCIYDTIMSAVDDIESEIFVNEYATFINENFDEIDVFVFNQLMEGWSVQDIAKMLECSTSYIEGIRLRFQKTYRRISA